MTRAVVFAVAALLPACTGQPVTAALEEPIRVHAAQFHEGELPGAPAVKNEGDGGFTTEPPTVTASFTAGAIVVNGQVGKRFHGITSPEAYAVAVKLDGLGSGYWVFPVTVEAENGNEGEFEFDVDVDFAPSVPAGFRDVVFVALAEDGHGGTQSGTEVCLASAIPDNFNSCEPEQDPPDVVLSLAWDAPVDLDLRVVTPDGKVLDGKHPTTANVDDAGVLDPAAAGVGEIDFDSNANCRIDGRQRENVLWTEKPSPPGRYYVYANLFDACGQPSVTYHATLYNQVAGKEPGTFALVETYRATGIVQAVQAGGSSKLGTFVTEFIVK